MKELLAIVFVATTGIVWAEELEAHAWYERDQLTGDIDDSYLRLPGDVQITGWQAGKRAFILPIPIPTNGLQ